LYLPKIFSQEAWEFLQKAAADICGILDKVMAHYLSSAEYRQLFPFEKELEELILSEAGYARLLPIARLDIFFNEDDFSFHFCEFNADGASAMNEDREINLAIKNSDAMKEFTKTHPLCGFEFFNSWVREFVQIYSTYNKKRDNPRIVITDIMENATPNEFLQFQSTFQKAGYDCEIFDIRRLVYTGGELQTPDGKRVDAIYRRAVTCDIMEYKADCAAFLQAVRDNAVCTIGHLRTQIIHNKALFEIFHMPQTLEILTEYEREYVLRHIPATFKLTAESLASQRFGKKDKWIIKPNDLYGSRGVFAGIDMEQADWEAALRGHADTGYLIQEFIPPYKSENLDFNGNPAPDFQEFNNITGLFVYNGRLQGIYSRAGLMGTISPFTRGLTLASLVHAPAR
jgi:hypothetical protein